MDPNEEETRDTMPAPPPDGPAQAAPKPVDPLDYYVLDDDGEID